MSAHTRARLDCGGVCVYMYCDAHTMHAYGECFVLVAVLCRQALQMRERAPCTENCTATAVGACLRYNCTSVRTACMRACMHRHLQACNLNTQTHIHIYTHAYT